MIERTVERLFFASRWLIAPVYLGLSLALVVLGIKFFEELFHALTHVTSVSEADVVLSLLALVDLALVAGLIVMVMFSGYENFVEDRRGRRRDCWLARQARCRLAEALWPRPSWRSPRSTCCKTMEAEKVESEVLLWYVIHSPSSPRPC
jgi:uncharacterized protein (TIGR00645 family)